MSRVTASVAVAATGVAALLLLAAASVSPSGVQLGCNAAAAGKSFSIFGSLDTTATAASPNLAPLVTGWTAPGSSALPVNVAGWPVLVFVQTTTGAAGTLYASAEATALPTAPTSTALPAAGAFLASPIACPGGRTRIMLDKSATASDSVLVYTTENSAANSATSCTYVATLTGGGSFVDVESGYVQIKVVAKPAATSIKVAGITDAGATGSGVATSVANAGVATVTGGTGVTVTATTGNASVVASAGTAGLTGQAATVQSITGNATLSAAIVGASVSIDGTTGAIDADSPGSVTVTGATGTTMTATTGNAIVTAPSPAGIVAMISGQDTIVQAGRDLDTQATSDVKFTTTDAAGTIQFKRPSTLGNLTLGPSGATFYPIGVGAGQAGVLSLRELAANGTNTASLRAPDALAADVALTLPSALPSATEILTVSSTGVIGTSPPMAKAGGHWSVESVPCAAGAEYLPAAGLASSAAVVAPILQIVSALDSVSRMVVDFTGDAANVAQTVTFSLLVDGVAVATTLATPAQAGAQTAAFAWGPTVVTTGKKLSVIVTPSAPLTAPLTLMSVAVR